MPVIPVVIQSFPRFYPDDQRGCVCFSRACSALMRPLMLKHGLGMGLMLSVLLLAPPVFAANIIFDNFGLLLSNNFFQSDFDPPTNVQSADDFLLVPGSSTITDVHWFGAYLFDNTPTASDDFTIRIFNDVGGVPEGIPTILDLNIGDVDRMESGFKIGSADIGGFDLFEFGGTFHQPRLRPRQPIGCRL